MTIDGFRVRKGIDSDLDAVKALADTNKDTLGFVLRPALAESIESDSLLIAERDEGSVVGFVRYRHRRDDQTTLYEICVHECFRGCGIGRAMVNALAAESMGHHKKRIRLKAPVDIAANGFYNTIGFTEVGISSGKKRKLRLWELRLDSEAEL